MKKRMICWGIAAWLALCQVSPALATDSVSAFAEADAAQEEEPLDGMTAPQNSAFLPFPEADGDEDDEKQEDIPLTDSQLPETWDGDCYGALPITEDSPPWHGSMERPSGDVTHTPAHDDYPALMNPPTPNEGSANNIERIGNTHIGGSAGNNLGSGSVVIDNNFGGDTYISRNIGGPVADDDPPPLPPKWLWPDGFGEMPIGSNPFTDLDATHYAATATLWAVGNGIVSGYADNTFRPANSCTHWHILTFLWRICVPLEERADALSVSEQRERIALWAEEKGLIADHGAFNGDEKCTRAEAMRYIWILSGRPTPGANATFRDLTKVGEENILAISWAVEMEITGGKTPEFFEPHEVCSRAHIVTFLYRAWQADRKSASQ